MSGIAVSAGNAGNFRYPVVWCQVTDEEPVFLIIKDDAVGLAAEEYVVDLLARIQQGDLDQADAWDHLMIKTADMDSPDLCRVEVRKQGNDLVADFRAAGLVRFTTGAL